MILLLILTFISVACFSESKVPRKGVKLLLSFGAAMSLSVLMESVAYTFVEKNLLEGLNMMMLYFLIPLVTFIPAQLLLFDIRVFDQD